jgi:hypothetical protein
MSSRTQYLRTIRDTVWLYPKADIQRGLAATTYTHTFDGTNIVCPDMAQLRGVYGDIFNQTIISQPLGNPGYSLGVGTILEDMNNTITWQLSGGHIVIRWQLVKQLIPQTQLPVSGSSPVDTVGYITTFTAFTPGPDPVFDAPYVVRIG